MAEEEGKIPVETSEKNEIEKEPPEEEIEVANPSPEEKDEKEEEEKELEEQKEEVGGLKEKNPEAEEANSDSVTVTVATASPYKDAVSGVKAEFNIAQLQELEQQTLIYRYMAASVPVPTHLVFPIWKTVTTSSTSTVTPEHFPTLMGLATLCLDFGKSPEPEPGRCRRTDGKKWRCWRNVLPDQKYCERHLHRGRKRPIQAVEISDDPDDATSSPAPVVAAAAAPGESDEGGKKKSKKVNNQVSVAVKTS